MKARNTAFLLVFVCVILGSSSQAVAGGKARANPPAVADPKFVVLSPLGTPPAIKLSAMAARLSSLDGKTIYIVDDGFVGGDVLLKEMAAWFTRNMPNVNTVYKRKAGGFPDPDPELWAEIKAKGDAVIMGVGH